MTANQYRKWMARNQKVYERTSFGIVRDGFKGMLRQLQKKEPTADNYELILREIVTEKAVFGMLHELYLTVGLIHHDKVIKGLKSEKINIKARWPVLRNDQFARVLMDWLEEIGGDRIVTIIETFIDSVIKLISGRLADGKSLTVISNEMMKTFGRKTGLYWWQMNRIARTETASATNYSAIKAMESQNLIIDKMWISTEDHRTRDGISDGEFDHLIMDGVTIPMNDYFKVENSEGEINHILYPVDMLNGVAGNIINCRCTTGPVPRRDKNGNLVLKKFN